jgi:hypothetical protein
VNKLHHSVPAARLSHGVFGLLAMPGRKNWVWIEGGPGRVENIERWLFSSNVAAFPHMLTFPCSLPHFTMSDGNSRRCKIQVYFVRFGEIARAI